MRYLLAAIACALLLPLSASAADKSDWYQVELLVFAQVHPNTSEHWDTSRLPHYDNQAIHFTDASAELPAAANSAQQQAAASGAWRLLPKDSKQALVDMERRMTNTGDFRTLFYGRWQQPIGSKQQTLPIYIQGGKQVTSSTPLAAPQAMSNEAAHTTPVSPASPVIGTPAENASTSLPELQGTITLSRATYLHLDTNLWFAAKSAGQTFFAHIDEPRRLKNGEVHYIDNPLFGVVIRITPVK